MKKICLFIYLSMILVSPKIMYTTTETNNSLDSNLHKLEAKRYNKPLWGMLQSLLGSGFIACAFLSGVGTIIGTPKRVVIATKTGYLMLGGYMLNCGIKNIIGEKAYPLPKK